VPALLEQIEAGHAASSSACAPRTRPRWSGCASRARRTSTGCSRPTSRRWTGCAG
jgi:hypothetical protein